MASKAHGTVAHLLQRTLPATFIVMLPTYASAQDVALEEVIVTATKRAESVQDVAMTVSAFSEQTIQEANINNANDLAIQAPTLNVSSNTNPFSSSFRIRGLGTAGNDTALEPSVGIFVDEVYLSRAGLGMSDLTDIERIEILSGPQGTLYGKNTNAGAISIFTAGPNTEEFEGYVEATLGDYDLQKYIAAASGPITDKLAYRITGTYHERDGYFDNGGPGDDLNDADDWNVRGKLLYDPTENLSILLTGSHVDRSVRCCAADAVQGESVNEQLIAEGLALDKNDPFDHEGAVDIDNDFKVEASALSAVIDYQLEWGSIKSITAWTNYDNENSYDTDRSELDVIRYLNAKSEGDNFSQELRFTLDQDETFEHMLGLFYYESSTKAGDGKPFVFIGDDFLTQGNEQEGLIEALPFPSLAFAAQPGDTLRANNDLDTESWAIFGQSTWHISDEWRVTGGLRWTDEEKDADLFSATDSTALSASLIGFSLLDTLSSPIDESFTRSSDDVNWLINTSYDISGNTMVYASVATGSKSGGFNTTNGSTDEREFDDEDTTNYEIGIKSTMLDARLRVNATIFYTEVDDLQFQQQRESGIGQVVANEAEVETSGMDLEIQALPLPNLTLGASLLYMDKYEITSGPRDGDDLGFVAEYSYNLNATLVFPLLDGGVYLRTDYSYMDDHLTSSTSAPSDRDMQDREDLNAKLGWRNERWNVSVWGRNLTDDEYAQVTLATYPWTSMDAQFLVPPRTYGATLRYEF
jgi:iron complex outermembrane receptor protein